MVWYLDTSAFLKILVREEHSEAMRAWFADHQPVWSSHLLRTETIRAAARLEVPAAAVNDALETVSLIMPSAGTFWRAGELEPVSLRTLDALHLATALELGEDLDGLLTYDDRLADAARAVDLPVTSPT